MYQRCSLWEMENLQQQQQQQQPKQYYDIKLRNENLQDVNKTMNSWHIATYFPLFGMNLRLFPSMKYARVSMCVCFWGCWIPRTTHPDHHFYAYTYSQFCHKQISRTAITQINTHAHFLHTSTAASTMPMYDAYKCQWKVLVVEMKRDKKSKWITKTWKKHTRRAFGDVMNRIDLDEHMDERCGRRRALMVRRTMEEI